MATAKFGSKTATAEPASVDNGNLTREQSGNQQAIVPKADSTLSTNLAKTGFVGAWDPSDVRLPRLNLVHKTSKEDMIAAFGIGGFAFNKEVKLGDGKTPISLTVLRSAKDYQQKLPYGSTDIPTICKTPEEVAKAGGTLDYSKQAVAEKIYFGPRAHMQIITPMPADVSEEGSALFPYEFNGISYGMALFTVASSAFTSAGKELATLCANNKVMRKGMWFGKLELTSESRQDAVNEWRIPVLKFAGENPADLVEFYLSLV